jgi:acyl-CoA thioesterase
MSGQANPVASSPRLLDLLTLERVEVNLFLTPVLHEGPSGPYGGQVAAQALRAAAATVAPQRHPHRALAGTSLICSDNDRARRV